MNKLYYACRQPNHAEWLSTTTVCSSSRVALIIITTIIISGFLKIKIYKNHNHVLLLRPSAGDYENSKAKKKKKMRVIRL